MKKSLPVLVLLLLTFLVLKPANVFADSDISSYYSQITIILNKSNEGLNYYNNAAGLLAEKNYSLAVPVLQDSIDSFNETLSLYSYLTIPDVPFTNLLIQEKQLNISMINKEKERAQAYKIFSDLADNQPYNAFTDKLNLLDKVASLSNELKDLYAQYISLSSDIKKSEKDYQIDQAFQKEFKRTMDTLPSEYQGIVDSNAIKSLTLDPANGNKTFSQIIIEKYGDAVKKIQESKTTITPSLPAPVISNSFDNLIKESKPIKTPKTVSNQQIKVKEIVASQASTPVIEQIQRISTPQSENILPTTIKKTWWQKVFSFFRFW